MKFSLATVWCRKFSLSLTDTTSVHLEPQNVAKSVFEKELTRYYGSVNLNNGSQNGAMLIAVSVRQNFELQTTAF
jgi:hypothetical protein